MVAVYVLHQFLLRLPEELRDLVAALVNAVRNYVPFVPSLPTTAASRLALARCGGLASLDLDAPRSHVTDEMINMVVRVNGSAPGIRILTMAESFSIVDAAGRRRAHAGMSAPRWARHVLFREMLSGSRGDVVGDVMRQLGLRAVIVVGNTPKRSRAGLRDGRKDHGGVEIVRVDCRFGHYEVRRSLRCNNLADEVVEALHLPIALTQRIGHSDVCDAHRNLAAIAAFVMPGPVRTDLLNKLQQLCRSNFPGTGAEAWIQQRVAIAASKNLTITDISWAPRADFDPRSYAIKYFRHRARGGPSIDARRFFIQEYDLQRSGWRAMYAVATLCTSAPPSSVQLRTHHRNFADSF